MSLESLRKLNSYPIHSVLDPAFSGYGKVVENHDVPEALAWLSANTEIPETGIYVPICPELESLAFCAKAAAEVFGCMEIQVGYCNGKTSGLDALEYHKSPEYTAADADVVLFLSSSLKMRGDRLPARPSRPSSFPPACPSSFPRSPCTSPPALPDRPVIAVLSPFPGVRTAPSKPPERPIPLPKPASFFQGTNGSSPILLAAGCSDEALFQGSRATA